MDSFAENDSEEEKAIVIILTAVGDIGRTIFPRRCVSLRNIGGIIFPTSMYQPRETSVAPLPGRPFAPFEPHWWDPLLSSIYHFRATFVGSFSIFDFSGPGNPGRTISLF